MNEQQKKVIIIDEIKHWRKNKLLPEAYCTFLLNLYSEGDQATDEITPVSLLTVSKSWWRWLLNILMIITILVVGINFNSFPNPLQIAIYGIFLLATYSAGFYFKRKMPFISQVLLGIASIGLLFVGNFIFHGDSVSFDGWFFLSVCLMWLLCGLFSPVTYLLYCGSIGILLLYGWMVHPRIAGEDSLFMGQLFWVPASLFLFWCYLAYRKKSWRMIKAIGYCSALMWIAPEIHFFVMEGVHSFVGQASLIGKIVIAGIVFYYIMQYKERTDQAISV